METFCFRRTIAHFGTISRILVLAGMCNDGRFLSVDQNAWSMCIWPKCLISVAKLLLPSSPISTNPFANENHGSKIHVPLSFAPDQPRAPHHARSIDYSGAVSPPLALPSHRGAGKAENRAAKRLLHILSSTQSGRLLLKRRRNKLGREASRESWRRTLRRGWNR